MVKTRVFWLAAFALLTALLISGTAFAEGEVPPVAPEEPVVAVEAAPAEEAAPPEEVVLPVEPVAVDTNVEPAPELEAPSAGEPAFGAETVLSPSVAEAPSPLVEAVEAALAEPVEAVLAEPVEAPVLVDAEGEPLVMASTESAETLKAADPYFISGGTTYSFYQAAGSCLGTPNCFDGLANPIQSAIDYIHLNATAPDNGRIYVEKATYTGSVVVDGSLANLNSLTELIGLPSVGLFPTISGSLTLQNLTGGFSLLGFNVTGGVLVKDSKGQFKFDMVTGNLTMNNVDSSGSTGHGIHIKNHKGNIVLDNVTSGNNNTSAGRGVWVENQLLGNVTITDSTFENNASHGVKLGAKGIVTIDNVVANGNNIGIVVDTCSSLTIRNTDASNNHTAGIWAEPLGKAVTLENVTAYKNGDTAIDDNYGIHLLNVGVVNANNVTANDNYNDGLRITANGTITLTSISAVDNDNNGVVVMSLVSPVIINGIVTNDNSHVGLVVQTKGTTLRNAVALNNGDGGIFINLSGGSGLLENVNANNNAYWGVFFETSPTVVVNMTMKNVGASQNDGGIHIETLGAVTITGSWAFQNTSFDGFYIATRGAVKLTDFWSGYNAGNGLKIEGIYTEEFIAGEWERVSMASPASVLINISANKTSFNGLQSNGQADDWDMGLHGAFIISERPVVINNFSANENHGYGIYVTGPEIFDRVLGSNILRRSGAVTIACTMPGMRSSAGRNMIGLEIFSAGTVTIAGLDTWENSNHGVDVNTLGAIVLRDARDNRNSESNSIALYNDEAVGSMPVTVSNVEVYETQADWGAALLVHSRGAITVNGLYMKGNNSMGAALGNAMAGRGNIIVSNTDINASNGVGLQAFSNGAIILTNVTVYESGQEGAYLANDGAPILAPVTLTNCEFSRNRYFGLEVESKGLITLRNVSAYENGSIGIDLYNNFAGTAAGVNLTNVTADGNNATGISVMTNGSAVLNSIYTHNNAKRWGNLSEGQTVQDFFNQSQGPDSWVFLANYDVTYSFKLQADAGWDLNRASFDPFIELYDSSDNPITVSGYCEENDYCEFSFKPDDFGYSGTDKYYVRVGSNTNDGFYRLSFNDKDPGDLPDEMFWVQGTAVIAGGSITVNGIESHSNSQVGLGATVVTNGAITLSNLHVSDNGAEGIYLVCGQDPLDFNHAGYGTGAITLSGDSFTHWNGWDGLIIATSGNVTIRKLDASGNGQRTGSSGFSIREDSSPKVLSFSNMNINESGGIGLWAFSTGNIILSKVNVNNNYSQGIHLDNCLDDGLGNCGGTGFVSLTNVWAQNNQGEGLEVYSKGAITLNTVEANNNGGGGIHLNNSFNASVASVVLTAVRGDNNNNTGIWVVTNGSLVMRDINANNNSKTWGGMNDGETMQGFYNNNKGPDQWWFVAEADTPYTLLMKADTGWAMNRFSFDPYLKLFKANGDEVTSGVSITYVTDSYYQLEWTPGILEGGSYFLQAGSSNGDLGDGNIFDGNSGFYRLSVFSSDPGDPITMWVDGLYYDVSGNVTMTGINTFNDNELTGFYGESSGAVSLTNIFASNNGTEGIYIENTGGSGNVTIAGTNDSSFNGWEGMRIQTNGVVSIANLGASGNGQDGVRITANTAGRQVTLLNVTASENKLKGLNLVSDGAAILLGFRGWFNGDDGANVDTNGYSLVAINSTFMCNNNYGLAYMGYSLPFTFTDFINIYLCNGNDNLKELH